MKIRALLGLGLCVAGLASAAWAGDLRFGYVNTERIYVEAPPALSAQKRLEKEFAQRENVVKEMAAKIKQLEDKLGRLDVSDPERRNRERELAQLGRDMQARQRELREDFALRRNEEFAAVQDRANRVIRSLAAREGFDVILQDAVYVNPRLDITEMVIKELAK